MLKILFSIIAILILILSVFFFYGGRYFDVTQKPIKSDIIACLGGGNTERIYKTVSLYNQGYLNQKTILLTGGDENNIAYIDRYLPGLKVIEDFKAKNTAEEIRFIKKYMVENHYKSVIIISDPPHSRRIKILTSLISIGTDEILSYVFVGSDVLWWQQDRYYRNHAALSFVLAETLKVPYTYFYYGIFEKFGIVWDESEYNVLRSFFGKLHHQLLSIIDEKI